MIPSSPRRTWLFLGITALLFFAPDLLTPEAWQQARLYSTLFASYQGLLIVLGFALGPAICRALVIEEIHAGPLRTSVDRVMSKLSPPLRVVIAGHALPFVLTAGLLPQRCQVFVSSALVARLTPNGLHFLLARASAHTTGRQRLAALLPILAFTVLIPDVPKGLATWLEISAFLLFWLLLHWLFELDADRQAARLLGAGASEGLRAVQAATASPLGWLSPQPPLSWRLRAISSTH